MIRKSIHILVLVLVVIVWLQVVNAETVLTNTECENVLEAVAANSNYDDANVAGCIRSGSKVTAIQFTIAALVAHHEKLASRLILEHGLSGADRYSPVAGKERFTKPLIVVAAQANMLSIVKELVEREPDIVNSQTGMWWTGANHRSALVLAIRGDAKPTFDYLLSIATVDNLRDSLVVSASADRICPYAYDIQRQMSQGDASLGEAQSEEFLRDAVPTCNAAFLYYFLTIANVLTISDKVRQNLYRWLLSETDAKSIEQKWRLLIRLDFEERSAACSFSSGEMSVVRERVSAWVMNRIDDERRNCN